MNTKKTKRTVLSALCSAGILLFSFYTLNAKSTVRKQNENYATITITARGKTLTATLNNSRAAKDFLAMLPLTLTLSDYGETEKVCDLPRKLSVSGSPAGYTPKAGDLAYYAPWGNLAVFRRDFGYSDRLVKLGRLDSGWEILNVSGEFTAVFEKSGAN